MYDYFKLNYIEKESFIYLSPSSINILKNEKIPIDLNFLLYSSFLFKEKVNITDNSSMIKGINIEYPKEDIIIKEAVIFFKIKLFIDNLYLNNDKNTYQLKFDFNVGNKNKEFVINLINFNRNIKVKTICPKENKFNPSYITPFETKPYIKYNYIEKLLSFPINAILDIIFFQNNQIYRINTQEFKKNQINNNQIYEICLDNILPLVCIYGDDWLPLIYFNKEDIYYIKKLDLYDTKKIE